MICESREIGARDTSGEFGLNRIPDVEERVNSYSLGSPLIEERLRALDAECDLETAAALLVPAALLLAGTRPLFKAVLGGLCLAGAVCGVGGAARLLKIARLRRRRTIEAEKLALKAIRGDFRELETELGRRACAMRLLRAA